MGAWEYRPSSSSVTLAINEVMANPLDEARDEYIELFNYGQLEVDAAGLVLTDGDSDDILQAFAENGPTTVAPNAYAIILDPGYDGFYGNLPAGTVLLTVGNATLGNGLSTNDPIRLKERRGRLVDTYSFPRNGGNGVSIEKHDVWAGDTRDNFSASPCGNSPGRENCVLLPPLDPEQVPLVITEVMSNALSETTGEYIEVFNTSEDTPFDMRNLKLTDGDRTDILLPFPGGDGATELAPLSFALILDRNYEQQYEIPAGTLIMTGVDDTLGNGLATTDPVTLLSPNGDVVLGSFGHPFDAGNGRSIERVSLDLMDIVVNWIPSPCPSRGSPGARNCAYDVELDLDYPIMVTEVMANPLDEDRGEYVEILNYGLEAIDIALLELGDGDTRDQLQAFEQGGPTELEPGELAMLVDSEYDGAYQIPDGVLLITMDDTTVGTSLTNNDPIYVFGPDGRLLDSYSTPFNAGNGYSVEKANLVVGDIGANWVRSPCRHSAGRLNCAITGQPPRVSSVALVISEVMANAVDDATGEFVELFNAGAVEVDLADFRVTDGDQVDDIVERDGGGTLLQPGQYAVILDQGYAGEYDLAAGALLVTVPNTQIGNGISNADDPVEILTAGGDLVDRFGFPTQLDDGESMEKRSLTSGDRLANWVASCDATGSTPGRRNCNSPNPLGGAAVLGQDCPSGTDDCVSALCLVNAFSGFAFCSQGCDGGNPCPADFSCVEVEADGGALDACVSDDQFREQNGQVGSPCPAGAEDCFSGMCLENPRGGLDFCSLECAGHDECGEHMLCVDTGHAELGDLCVPEGLIRDGVTGDPCPIGGIDCLSDICLQPPEGDSYCSVGCAADPCPGDWACQDAGDDRVCVAP